MHKYLYIVTTLFIIFPNISFSNSTINDGNEFLHSLNYHHDIAYAKGKTDFSLIEGSNAFYAISIVDTTVYLSGFFKDKYKVCFPKNLTRNDTYKAVKDYLINNPDKLNRHPNSLALSAIRHSYRCS